MMFNRKVSGSNPRADKGTIMLPAKELLLLATLEELTEGGGNLEQFQRFLTSLLPIFPPIPESQLDGPDRQDTVDEMVQTLGPEDAVKVTLRILRNLKQFDLAKKLERNYKQVIPCSKGLLTTPGASEDQETYDDIEEGAGEEYVSMCDLGSPQPHIIPEGEHIYENWDVIDITATSAPPHISIPERGAEGPYPNIKPQLKGMLKRSLSLNDLQVRTPSSSRRVSGDKGEYISLISSSLSPLDKKQLSSKATEMCPTMPSVPDLLLATLEMLNAEEFKRFLSHLAHCLLSIFPPIPWNQLENADTKVTVDKMVQSYSPEYAVKITVVILKMMNWFDLAEKLRNNYRLGTKTAWNVSPSSHTSSLSKGKENKEELFVSSPSAKQNKPFAIQSNKDALVMGPTTLTITDLLQVTLMKLNKKRRITFFLTGSLLPGFPPIPDSQLRYANIGVKVDKMVQIFGPEGAVKITLRILREMNLHNIADELKREHSRDSPLFL
ncbi:uncharacterized protein LOC120026354 isoform X2 [Salvelinus namaycush]|uniref:Uncharacterized protein LOC120026354 isoform X2 n=1 Tax=Salvelinus namaycush TaxID=8040 RepID=A0A8U0TS03_SALNM|nr:uncharacterized protein LOC120026354 isoform X2 [Salvelinus namaycush]